jgi:hypothetical protein
MTREPSSTNSEPPSNEPAPSLVDFLASIPFDDLEIPDRDRDDVGRNHSL